MRQSRQEILRPSLMLGPQLSFGFCVFGSPMERAFFRSRPRSETGRNIISPFSAGPDLMRAGAAAAPEGAPPRANDQAQAKQSDTAPTGAFLLDPEWPKKSKSGRPRRCLFRGRSDASPAISPTF